MEKAKTGAKPFVKWVGGKGKLLEQFERYYPAGLKDGTIHNYVEPFLGGGALYFSILEKYKIKNAYLFDLNRDLVLTYNVIQRMAFKKHGFYCFSEENGKYQERIIPKNLLPDDILLECA